jgi:hypothetical protein
MMFGWLRSALPGRELMAPIGLRLLVEGVEYDADTAASRVVAVTSWLRPVTGPPIWLVESPPPASPPPGPQPGTVTITRIGTDVPPTLRVDAAAGHNPHVAPAVDGRGVWISEYRSRTRCSLREVALDGRTRRPARDVPCGVEPLLETPHGLWVSRWVNLYTLAGREVDLHEPTYALLDPETLRPRASYAEAIVIGAHHVLTMNDQEGDLCCATCAPVRPAGWTTRLG